MNIKPTINPIISSGPIRQKKINLTKQNSIANKLTIKGAMTNHPIISPIIKPIVPIIFTINGVAGI